RKNFTKNPKLALFLSPRQTSRHDVRRRHATVGGLMMLVDANAVEAQLIRELQFVQITVVERMAQLGVIKRVGTSYPGALMRLRKIFRQISPGHQMKAI